jgi:hypothetical protein
VDGIVIEGSKDHCAYGYPQYLLPTIASHEITDPLLKNNYSVLMPIAQGIGPTRPPQQSEHDAAPDHIGRFLFQALSHGYENDG